MAVIGTRAIYILPTATGIAYGGMLFATLVGSLNYQNNLGLFFTFLMAGISLVSMHHCWFNLLGLGVAAEGGAPVFCGQPARFHIELRERRGRARGEICVQAAGCLVLAAGARAATPLEHATTRRGALPLDEVVLETRHPLGLFRAWARAQVRAEVLVYPRPAARAPAPALADAMEHRAKGEQGAGADDFVGPRPYRPGDSPRQLDWKALARGRGLVVKQFGGDRAARVWLDYQALGGSHEERLSTLARQVLDAHEQQARYGMDLPGQRIESDAGEAHEHRCLEALARQPGAAAGHGALDGD